MTQATPAEAAVEIAVHLEAAGVAHAIGGAIAYGYWGVPRGTQDLDLNLFVPAEDARDALGILVDAGVELNVEESIRRGIERGDARGYWHGVPVDVFFLSVPLHESAAKRTVKVRLLGREIRILSAEDLVVLKMLFFRGKDVVDVERVVAAGRKALDREYVREWIIACVGGDDARVQKWDELCSAIPDQRER